MTIVIIKDDGVERRPCRKIEPATLSEGKIIVDEAETVDLENVMMIVEG